VFSTAASAKQLILEADVEDAVPRMVMGDPVRLKQVLTNLVGNALKFTSRGRILVKVTLRAVLGEDVELVFAVSDTGIGISKDKQALIFQAFSQADGTITRRYGGTGLGLTISARLVELMKGKIWIESEEDLGSTFQFTAVFGNVHAPELADPPKIQFDDESEFQPPLHVLLAEDNPINQKVATRLLEKRGHRVEVARTGLEAVTAASRRQFDLILMDIQMPVMGGFEATAIIRLDERTSGRRVPIIAMTAHAMEGDRERCLQSGMDDYIPKPIDPKVLYTMLSRYLPAAAYRR
jgi:CheY-like chemotaxis protein